MEIAMMKHPGKRPDRQTSVGLQSGGERLPGPGTPSAPADQNPSSHSSREAAEPQPPLEPPLTIAEVARYYRISPRTVQRRIKDGTLQNELEQGRLVRISVEQLRRLAGKAD